MRRKIEKAKKPAEKISNGDDILNEEINEYKVGFTRLKSPFLSQTLDLIFQGGNRVLNIVFVVFRCFAEVRHMARLLPQIFPSNLL